MPSGPFAHVCMLVKDLDKAVEDWTKMLRVLDPGQLEDPIVRYDTFSSGADAGMKWATFVSHHATEIQFIQPAPGTPLGDRLEKMGEHVHHLCFTTTDVPGTLAKLSSEGIQLAGGGKTYNDPDMTWQKWGWVSPKSAHGVLLEIASPVRKSSGRQVASGVGARSEAEARLRRSFYALSKRVKVSPVRFDLTLLNSMHVVAMTQPWEHALDGTHIARAARVADELGYWKLLTGEHFIIPTSHVPLSGDHYLHSVAATIVRRQFRAAHEAILVGDHPALAAPHRAGKSLGDARLAERRPRRRARRRRLARGRISDAQRAVPRARPSVRRIHRRHDRAVDAATRRNSRASTFRSRTWDSHPKPVQKPHLPLWCGGDADNVLKRVARWGSGWSPFRTPPEKFPERLDFIRSQPDYHGAPSGSHVRHVDAQRRRCPRGDGRSARPGLVGCAKDHRSVQLAQGSRRHGGRRTAAAAAKTWRPISIVYAGSPPKSCPRSADGDPHRNPSSIQRARSDHDRCEPFQIEPGKTGRDHPGFDAEADQDGHSLDGSARDHQPRRLGRHGQVLRHREDDLRQSESSGSRHLQAMEELAAGSLQDVSPVSVSHGQSVGSRRR